VRVGLAVLGGLALVATAHAEDVETKLRRSVLASVRANSGAAFRAQVAAQPLRLYHVWFDSPACTKEFGGKVSVPTGRVPALVACLARLELTDGADGTFVHAPGVAIAPLIYRGRLAGLSGVTVAAGVPTIHDDALAKHLATGTLAVEADAATRAAGKPASVWLEACVDARGTISAISTKRSTAPTFAKAVATAASTWTFKPFERGGKPIRVCLQRRYAFPAD